jgi:hypothetical protein
VKSHFTKYFPAKPLEIDKQNGVVSVIYKKASYHKSAQSILIFEGVEQDSQEAWLLGYSFTSLKDSECAAAKEVAVNASKKLASISADAALAGLIAAIPAGVSAGVAGGPFVGVALPAALAAGILKAKTVFDEKGGRESFRATASAKLEKVSLKVGLWQSRGKVLEGIIKAYDSRGEEHIQALPKESCLPEADTRICSWQVPIEEMLAVIAKISYEELDAPYYQEPPAESTYDSFSWILEKLNYFPICKEALKQIEQQNIQPISLLQHLGAVCVADEVSQKCLVI